MSGVVYLLRLPGFEHNKGVEDDLLESCTPRLKNHGIDRPVTVEASDLLGRPGAPLGCLIVLIDADTLERKLTTPKASAADLQVMFSKLRAVRLNGHVMAAALYHQQNAQDTWKKYRKTCRCWTDFALVPIGDKKSEHVDESVKKYFQSRNIGEYLDKEAFGGVVEHIRQMMLSGLSSRPTVTVYGEASLLPPALSGDSAFFARTQAPPNKVLGAIARMVLPRGSADSLAAFVLSGGTKEELSRNVQKLYDGSSNDRPLLRLAEDRRPFLLAIRGARRRSPTLGEVQRALSHWRAEIRVETLVPPTPDIDDYFSYFVARIPEDVRNPAASGNSSFVNGLGRRAA